MLVVSACTRRQSELTITIGVVLPRSGEFAPLGESALNGVRLAVDEANETTGLQIAGRPSRVALRIEDDRGEAASAGMAVKKLADAGVTAIIGPVQPETAEAVADAARSAGLLLIVPTVSDPDLVTRSPLVFRACFDDRYAGEAMAVYAFRTLRARRAAVLFDAATPYNATLADAFARRFIQLGGVIAATESFTDERAATDFHPTLERIRAARPDVLFSPNYYRATAAIAAQARAAGLFVPVLSGEGANSPDFPLIGGDVVEGAAFPAHFSLDDPRPAVVRFRARYRSAYQREPDTFAALAYDAGRLLLTALRRAGSGEAAAIRAALLQTRDFPGVTGVITFGGTQSPRKDVAIIGVRHGSLTFETTVRP